MPFDPQGTGAAPDDVLVRRGVSWESAARLARYTFFADTAKARSCSRLILAHHADDLVETVHVRAHVMDDQRVRREGGGLSTG